MLDRDKLVLEFWERKSYLSIKNKEYRNFVSRILSILLKNDIKNGDITTNSLIKKHISAAIIAKEDGVVAGLEEFRLINKDLKLKFFKKDGDKIKSGNPIVEINGYAKYILPRERISLNLLQRMSGIATLTSELSKKSGSARIAATRKTPWGLLDKKAVSVGGGLTHRLNLGDGIIVKDNHLGLLGYNFAEIINLAKNKSKNIEIEVENKRHALEATRAIKNVIGKSNKIHFALMLDKIKPEDIKSVIKELKKMDIYESLLLEASGNINKDNLAEYSDCGVDIISMGSLTNSAKALNMSQEIA
mgnify:FL=1